MVQKIWMPKKEIIGGQYVRSEMVLWHLESRPQVKSTINGGQCVPFAMILWHSNTISAPADQPLEPVQLHKLKMLYILVFCTFFYDWRQMGNLRAFIRPGTLETFFHLSHTIRKVKFLSKNSILTKPQHFYEFFAQIFFDNFSREIKVVNS